MVYLGVDNTGTEAAVKVLHIDWDRSGTLQRDLERELVSVRRLAPFLTAKVLDFDLTGPVPFIASEYIEGPTLAESVQENGTLKESSLHQIAMQTMTALEAIHEAGLIHCDFKPANIILGKHGTRIIDFGIARTLDSTHRVGEVAGTIPFMAPEQIANAHLSPKVDLFAWGSTMVFAGTGRRAFPGDDPTTMKRRILREPPQLYDLDESLRDIIRLCLRKDPKRRPTSARARRMLLGFRVPASAEGRAQATPTADRRPAAAAPGAAAEGKPAAFVPGVATPGAVNRQPVPAPTRVERIGIRRAPGPLPQPVAPQHGDPDQTLGGGRRLGKWWVATAAAVTVVGIVVLTKAGLGNSSEPNETPESIVAAASQNPVQVLKGYVADWSDAACKQNDASDRTVQVERWKCSMQWSAEAITIYCIRYTDVDIMEEKGRPRVGVPHVKRVRWEKDWYRSDDPRGGPFVSYTLDDGRAAVWWQDTVNPVACIIFGPEGSDEVLLDAFYQHNFKLSQPVPSAS
jgi:hypothetical protein